MSSFIGDYSCKLDVKGRVMLPSAFKKHLSAEAQNKFVVKKDIFEKCLVLYPMDEWDRQTTILRAKINPYNKEHNKFLRGFYRGTAELELDTNNRLLMPRRLIDLVEIGREVIMAGQDDRIEIWAKDQYGKVASGEDEFADLAEKILGGTENEKNEQ
jgi:MraZ protein